MIILNRWLELKGLFNLATNHLVVINQRVSRGGWFSNLAMI